MRRLNCIGCALQLGDGTDCPVCSMFLSDMEARQEDADLMARGTEPSDLADHYPIGG